MQAQAVTRISEGCDWVNPSVRSNAPPWASQELIESTLRVWQPYYSVALTLDDAKQILFSVGRMIDLLGESTDESLDETS